MTKEQAREEVRAISKILPSVTNKDLRSHLLTEKRKLESIIALHEVREESARNLSRAIAAENARTHRETRIIT